MDKRPNRLSKKESRGCHPSQCHKPDDNDYVTHYCFEFHALRQLFDNASQCLRLSFTKFNQPV